MDIIIKWGRRWLEASPRALSDSSPDKCSKSPDISQGTDGPAGHLTGLRPCCSHNCVERYCNKPSGEISGNIELRNSWGIYSNSTLSESLKFKKNILLLSVRIMNNLRRITKSFRIHQKEDNTWFGNKTLIHFEKKFN